MLIAGIIETHEDSATRKILLGSLGILIDACYEPRNGTCCLPSKANPTVWSFSVAMWVPEEKEKKKRNACRKGER
jgi:hypothetical protein